MIQFDTSKYRNYDTSNLSSDIRRLTSKAEGKNISEYALSEQDILNNNSIMTQTKNDMINQIHDLSSIEAYETTKAKVISILKKEVLNVVIKDLVGDQPAEEWVRKGLNIHENSDKCKYCGNTISKERIIDLKNHFNDEYQTLINEIDSLMNIFREWKNDHQKYRLLDVNVFYDNYQSEYSELLEQYNIEFSKHVENIDCLFNALEKKKSHMNEDMQLSNMTDSNLQMVISNINKTISNNNNMTNNIETNKSKAIEDIHNHIIASNYPEYSKLEKSSKQSEDKLTDARDDLSEKKKERNVLKSKLTSHLPNAKELTKGLRSFLGSNEITVKAIDEEYQKGYRIYRGDIVAKHLSEGEKNALALVYFLTSLNDEGSKDRPGFDRENGVVVLDDPVSSFDNNSLYYACEYILRELTNVDQIIILTHNYHFYKRIRKMDLGCRSEFMITKLTDSDIDKCFSSISKSSDLITNYDSEYQYLFKCVYDISNKNDNNYEMIFCMPNITRRLLEAFLAFKVPCRNNEKYDFTSTLNSRNIIMEKSRRVKLKEYLHPFNHMDRVIECESTYIDFLSYMPEIATDILELMHNNDKCHFEGMLISIGVSYEKWKNQHPN